MAEQTPSIWRWRRGVYEFRRLCGDGWWTALAYAVKHGQRSLEIRAVTAAMTRRLAGERTDAGLLAAVDELLEAANHTFVPIGMVDAIDTLRAARSREKNGSSAGSDQ